MMSDRQKALMRVQTYGFALDEAVLFLDTHPSDSHAMKYYHETLMQYNAAVSDYVSKYGPLNVSQVNGNAWTWATDCMPWEGECNVEV